MENIILFGIVILITHFLEAITGFGCTVIAMPFCVLLAGVKTAVPPLTALSFILSCYIVFIDGKSIVWKSYLKIIAFVGLGLPFGMMIFSYLPENMLKKILGGFMLIIAAQGIYSSFQMNKTKRPLNNSVLNFILFLGGIIHGAFSTGGPFVVIYATRALKNKRNFRATLSAVWLTLNGILIIKMIISGAFSNGARILFLASIPFLAVGMLLGNKVHKKIKDQLFTKLVYIVLFIAGFFMFL